MKIYNGTSLLGRVIENDDVRAHHGHLPTLIKSKVKKLKHRERRESKEIIKNENT